LIQAGVLNGITQGAKASVLSTSGSPSNDHTNAEQGLGNAVASGFRRHLAKRSELKNRSFGSGNTEFGRKA